MCSYGLSGCLVSVWAGVVQTAGLSSRQSSHWQSDPAQRRLRSYFPLRSQVSANYYNSNSQFDWRASTQILMFWVYNSRFKGTEARNQLPSWVRPYVKIYDGFGTMVRDAAHFFRTAQKTVSPFLVCFPVP